MVHLKHLPKNPPITVLGQMFHLTIYIHCFFFQNTISKLQQTLLKLAKLNCYSSQSVLLHSSALSLKASCFSEKNVLVKEKLPQLCSQMLKHFAGL